MFDNDRIFTIPIGLSVPISSKEDLIKDYKREIKEAEDSIKELQYEIKEQEERIKKYKELLANLEGGENE